MAGAKTTTATQASSSTNPAAERIRENQRRSRARRKEFVEGMQRRLDEYEKQGVDATLQMQQAARTVAIENARLRLLLARRGVSNTEVDKFLGMFDARDDDILPAGNGLQGFPPPSTTPAYTHTASTTSTYQHHDPLHDETAGIDRLAVLADASIGDSCSSSTSATTPSESTVAAQSPPSAGPSTMPGTPVSGPHSHYHSHPPQHHHHHHHHATPQPQAGTGSPLVMSCNTAAQIIAEMQGGAPVNRHAVKASLGCEDAECECFVKNTLLFQIMEKNTA